jgi:hypothetical protein
MAILTGKPVKAFIEQDHQSHIATHMAFAQDPKIQEMVGQSPNADALTSAMAAHVAEHLAYQYRRDIEMQIGGPLPDPTQPLPPEVEFTLAKVQAEAGQRLLAKDQQEMAQKQAEQMAQDPLIQIQMAELEIKRAEVERKARKDELDATLGKQALDQDAQIEIAKLAAAERQAGVKIGVDAAKARSKAEQDAAIAAQKLQAEGARLGVQIAQDKSRAQLEKQRLDTQKSIEQLRAKTQIKAQKLSIKTRPKEDK